MPARIRLESSWSPLTSDGVASVRGHMGVYELRDDSGRVIRVGYAGGRSLFGLQGELRAELQRYQGRDICFRYEVTSAYLSRYREVLMLDVNDAGTVPADNTETCSMVGRLRPAGA